MGPKHSFASRQSSLSLVAVRPLSSSLNKTSEHPFFERKKERKKITDWIVSSWFNLVISQFLTCHPRERETKPVLHLRTNFVIVSNECEIVE